MMSLPHRSPPFVLPRGLILLAALWLVASWLRAVGITPPLQASSAGYEPGVRMLLLLIATGLTILWPLLRLSQPATRFPLRLVLTDMIVLLCLLQVVIWPVRLLTRWTAGRTLAIDGTLAGWTLIVGAVLVTAVPMRQTLVRGAAMAACAALAVVPALLGTALLGPVTGPLVLSRGGGSPVSADEWLMIRILMIAAIAAWACALLATAWRRPGTAPPPPRRERDHPPDTAGPPPARGHDTDSLERSRHAALAPVT